MQGFTIVYAVGGLLAGSRTGVPILDGITRLPTLTVNSCPATEISMLDPLSFNPLNDACGAQLGSFGLIVTVPSISNLTPNIPKMMH